MTHLMMLVDYKADEGTDFTPPPQQQKAPTPSTPAKNLGKNKNILAVHCGGFLIYGVVIMSFLNSIKRNKAKTERVIIYGESGLGKTTFATSAPNPIVIQTEDGLGEIDVPCFPLAESYIDVMEGTGRAC